MRLVAWVALFQRVSAGEAVVERGWWGVAGSSWLGFVHGSEGFGTVIVGEPGVLGAGGAGRGGIVVPSAM